MLLKLISGWQKLAVEFKKLFRVIERMQLMEVSERERFSIKPRKAQARKLI